MKEIKPVMKLIVRGKKREFLSAIGKSLNLLLPTESNTSSRSEKLTALWLSPDEWMIYSKETLNSENNVYETENLLNKNISKKNITLCNIIIDKKNPRNEIIVSLDSDNYENKSIIVVDDVLNSGSTLMYAVKYFLETSILL